MGNAPFNLATSLQQNILPKPKGCCNQISLFISKGKSDPSDVTCSICFRIFSKPRVMKCKHTYCQDCIREWGRGSTVSCPYCRVEIKRQRGTFGRIDKKTEKKIDNLEFKCRNCCWEGSYFLFLTTFDIQPYLDDASLPSQNIKCDENDSCQHLIDEENREKPEVQRTATKQQEKHQEKQVNEQVKIEQKVTLPNEKTSKAFDIFIGTVLSMARNGTLDVSPIERELLNRGDRRM